MQRINTTRRLVLTGLFSALFVISTLIPVSVYIGGAGFITLEIVLVPVIAFILEPWQALLASLVGGVVGYFFGTGLAPVFGPFSPFIPALAAYFGSIAFHYDEKWFRWSSPVWLTLPGGYIAFGIVYYLAFSRGTVVWLIPYFLAALGLAYRPLAKDSTTKIAIGCLTTAMSEQVGLNVASISLLGIQGAAWLVIAPFMFTERTIATAGSFIVIKALLRLNYPPIRSANYPVNK